jgi:hypothetical protein
MRSAFNRGDNAMQNSRESSNDPGNSPMSTLVAFDLMERQCSSSDLSKGLSRAVTASGEMEKVCQPVHLNLCGIPVILLMSSFIFILSSDSLREDCWDTDLAYINNYVIKLMESQIPSNLEKVGDE